MSRMGLLNSLSNIAPIPHREEISNFDSSSSQINISSIQPRILYPSSQNQQQAADSFRLCSSQFQIPDFEKENSSLAMAGESSGIVVSYSGRVIYFQETGGSASEAFSDLGQISYKGKKVGITDLVYYSPIQTFFASDIRNRVLFKLRLNFLPGSSDDLTLGNSPSLITDVEFSELKFPNILGSTFRLSHSTNNLLGVNLTDKITVFARIDKDGYGNSSSIRPSISTSINESITNFIFLGSARVLLVTSIGRMVMFQTDPKRQICELRLKLGSKKTHHRTRCLEVNEKGDIAFVTSYCFNDTKAFYKDKVYAVRVLAEGLEVLAVVDVFEERKHYDWSAIIVSQPLVDQKPLVYCLGTKYYSVFQLETVEGTAECRLVLKGGEANCAPKSKMHKLVKEGDGYWGVDKYGIVY